MKKHVAHFEVLRGCAALWVLVSHVLLIVGLHIPFLSRGDQAVEVFVILSGFVIGMMRNNEHEAYGRYIFRRFMRLYPLFVIALVLGGLTAHLYAPVFGGSPWLKEVNDAFLTREQNASSYFWQHVVLHLTMLHGAVPDTMLPQAALMFSGPLWSISLEWQFYLIAPLLIAAISFRSYASAAIALVILAVAAALQKFVSGVWIGEVPSFLPLRLPLFIVGIICASVWDKSRQSPPATLAIVVALATVFIWVFAPNKLPILIWFGVYFIAATHDKIGISRLADRVVSHAVPRLLGRISYGVYVLHVPMLMLVAQYLVIPVAAGQSRWIAAAMLTFITVPIVLALAWLSFENIEKPAAKWARGWTSKRAATA